jgi:hypothetical protein
VQTLAVWSLVKFFAGLGGILTGEFFGRLTWHAMNWSPAPPPDIKEFVTAFFITTIAFVTAAAQVYFTESFPEWRDRHYRLFKPFSKLHQFLTRYDPEQS